MRRFVCMVFVVVFALSGCGKSPAKPTQEVYSPTASAPRVTQNTIESGSQYEILELGPWEYAYVIYDMHGNVINRVETGGAYPEISLLEDNILDAQVKKGTGIIVHQYYNLSENLISEEYQDVIAYCNGNVAYIDVPQEDPLQNQRLAVQRIFEEDALPKTYDVDFGPVVFPVIDAHFINDGDAIIITYLAGEELNESTQTIDLT